MDICFPLSWLFLVVELLFYSNSIPYIYLSILLLCPGVRLKLGSVSPPSMFFFFNIVLANLVPDNYI